MILKNKYPILWLLLVFFYLLDISLGISILSYIFLISLIFNLGNKYYFLQNLPYAILLSPALISVQIGSIQLLFSDLFIFFGGIFFIFKNIINNKKFTYNIKSSLLVKIFISICLFNLLNILLFTLLQVNINLKFIFYILTHLIVLFTFLSFDISLKDQKLLLKSFLISVFFASIISIVYYFKGISLLGWTGEEFTKSSELNAFSFFKATFFYTGFFVYLGCSIALLAYLLIKKNLTFKMKFIILIVLIIEILVSFPFINKTLYASLIGTFILVQLYLNKGNLFLFIKSIFYKVFFISAIIFSVISIVDTSAYDRFFRESVHTDSLVVRFYIFINSLEILSSNFFNLIFGEGISFLMSNTPKSFLYRKNSEGLIEGTVDSQYMNILIETGLIGFILVLIFAFAVFYKCIRIKKNQYWFSVPIVITFSFIAISFLTQRMGLSKLSLILPVLTAVLAKFNFKNNTIKQQNHIT